MTEHDEVQSQKKEASANDPSEPTGVSTSEPTTELSEMLEGVIGGLRSKLTEQLDELRSSFSERMNDVLQAQQQEREEIASELESERRRFEQERQDFQAELRRFAEERTELQGRLDKASEDNERARSELERANDDHKQQILALSDVPAPEPDPDAGEEQRETGRLREAMGQLDEAPSQAEILSRLLEQTSSFAARAALLIGPDELNAEDDRLKLWNAIGFDEPLAGLTVAAPETWSAALSGDATLSLDGAEQDNLASTIGASEPRQALVIPFILRNSTRALLYCDDAGLESAVDAESVQILCFSAAQALETLPMRSLRPSATLQLPLRPPEAGVASAAGAGESEETASTDSRGGAAALAAGAATAAAVAWSDSDALDETISGPVVPPIPDETGPSEADELDESHSAPTDTHELEAVEPVADPDDAPGDGEGDPLSEEDEIDSGADGVAAEEAEHDAPLDAAEPEDAPEEPALPDLADSQAPEPTPDTPDDADDDATDAGVDPAVAAAAAEDDEDIGDTDSPEGEQDASPAAQHGWGQRVGDSLSTDPASEPVNEADQVVPPAGDPNRTVAFPAFDAASWKPSDAPPPEPATPAGDVEDGADVLEPPAVLSAPGTPSPEEEDGNASAEPVDPIWSADATSQTRDDAAATTEDASQASSLVSEADEGLETEKPTSHVFDSLKPAADPVVASPFDELTQTARSDSALQPPRAPFDTSPQQPPPPAAPAPPTVPPETREPEPGQTVAAKDSAESLDTVESTGPVIEQPALTPVGVDQPAKPEKRGSSEVLPPDDLDGPGWAFTGSSKSSPDDDDPLHEEAKRLARLLVSEIKLYNEEQIETGKAQGNIYLQLREDIDRSRKMYDERVDPSVRSTSDYFKDELVRNLADGNASVLGI